MLEMRTVESLCVCWGRGREEFCSHLPRSVTAMFSIRNNHNLVLLSCPCVLSSNIYFDSGTYTKKFLTVELKTLFNLCHVFRHPSY